ncbi:MAG: DUF2812 domain-containing protein [Ruminococcaceae bacterium]|nr:DUF2812 domain-containing protein [Oscillospiraceae bacterium]
MNTTKRLLIKPFLPYDKVAMERYLRQQTLRGWFLDNTKAGWVFYRTETRTLQFSVFFFPDAKAYYPAMTLRQKDFLELCDHTGWHLAKHFPGMLVLYSEDPDAIPVETDPVLEVENIRKATVPWYNRLFWFFLTLAILVGRSTWSSFQNATGLHFVDDWAAAGVKQIEILASDVLLLPIMAILAILCYVAETLGFHLWMHKAGRLAEREGYIPAVRQKWNVSPWIWLGIGATGMLALYLGDARYFPVFLMLSISVAVALVCGVMRMLKERRSSPRVRALTAVVSGLILASVLVTLVFSPAIPGSLGKPERHQVMGQYQGESHTFWQEEIPLRIEDLLGEAWVENGVETYWRGNESFLIGRYFAFQRFCEDEPAKDIIKYVITDINIPGIYETMKAKIMDLDDRDPTAGIFYTRSATDSDYWQEIWCDPDNHLQIYQLYNDDGARTLYILCMETRIVDFYSTWSLTETQLLQVAETLSSCPLPNT